jgi:hypothetical protein
MKQLHIVTAYTSNISDLSNLSYDSLTKYCSKHNISYERHLLENLERPASWYKIPTILSKLDLYDYVMWIDSDTTFINYDYNVLDLLGDSDIYVSKDINGINCGVMIWKNTETSKTILNKIWSMTEFINHHWWEQAAFHELYNENYNEMQHITKLIDQNVLNSYDYSLYGLTYQPGQVNDNSLLIHLPGLDLQQRITIINNYKQKYDISN